jgi:hypothetical protein
VENDPFVYEARYSLRGRSGVVVVLSMVFVIVGIVGPLSPAVRILDFALFGAGGLLMLITGLSRRVALRVDARGVTLGGIPPRYRSGTRFVPWADIEQVVLWRQSLPYGRSMPYVGLRRRPGAPPLGGKKTQLAGRAVAATLTRGISADTLGVSRAVNGWRLDPDRLARAVNYFAPGVRIEG